MKSWYRYFLPFAALLWAYQTPVFDSLSEINAAQAWFQNHCAGTDFLGQPLQPDWNAAQVSKPYPDRLIIDIPLLNGDQYKMAIKHNDTGQVDTAEQNGATRLVLTRFANNQYVAALFHVFGTPAFINQYGKPATAQTKPHAVQPNFTGRMFYTLLDGKPIAGIYVENGQVRASLTPVEPNSVIPRSCTTIETICIDSGNGWLCVDFVLCEVLDTPGGNITAGGGGGGNEWWGNGPTLNCFDCLGGGYFPPLCPDGNPMPPGGSCPTEPEGPCQLTNTYVTAPGPFADEYFVGGIIPYPWNAWTNVVGKLTDCENGDATFDIIITTQTGGVTIGDKHVFMTDKNNYQPGKYWGVKTQNYAQFLFEVEIFGLKFTSVANSSNESFLTLKYN